MTWRAHIAEGDLLGRALDITIGMQHPDGSVTLVRSDSMLENLPDGSVGQPTLQIPEPAARALHEALARRFATGETGSVLRKDYDAERARVDRLIDHLLGGTHG